VFSLTAQPAAFICFVLTPIPRTQELARAIPSIVAAALPRDSLLDFKEWLDLFALRLVRGIHSIDFGG
jgi:hypothetical protein